MNRGSGGTNPSMPILSKPQVAVTANVKGRLMDRPEDVPTSCALPLAGQRYRWPIVGETFEILDVAVNVIKREGTSRTDVLVKISDGVGWVPWCDGRGFVLISDV